VTTLDPLAEETYDIVQTMAEWRLGRSRIEHRTGSQGKRVLCTVSISMADLCGVGGVRERHQPRFSIYLSPMLQVNTPTLYSGTGAISVAGTMTSRTNSDIMWPHAGEVLRWLIWVVWWLRLLRPQRGRDVGK
jgi:hypothetical protein